MILVDSSVWIDFFNGYSSPQAVKLRGLIASGKEIAVTGIIAAEVLSGFKDEKTFEEVKDTFLKIPQIPHGFESHIEAAKLYRELRSKGITIRSIIDCLIAAVAIANNLELLCKDRDFVKIKEHYPELELVS